MKAHNTGRTCYTPSERESEAPPMHSGDSYSPKSKIYPTVTLVKTSIQVYGKFQEPVFHFMVISDMLCVAHAAIF